MNCERCGCQPQYDSEEDTKPEILDIGFGVLTSLCYECKKEWQAHTVTHPLYHHHTLVDFRLQTYYKSKETVATADAEQMLLDYVASEVKIHNFLQKWLQK